MKRSGYDSNGISRELREALRSSDESMRALARRHGINPKTVAKWKQREHPEDLPRGPGKGSHRALSPEDEQIIVRFREHTLLPLDDCLYALQANIPHLTRSSLHRCFQRHGISRLEKPVAATLPAAQEHLAQLGCVHIDMAQVQSADGTHILFNAIDTASKFVVVQIGGGQSDRDAADFLRSLAEQVPFRIVRAITPQDTPFRENGAFGRARASLGVEHVCVESASSWSDARRNPIDDMMQSTILYSSRAYLCRLIESMVDAHNLRRRLKTLGGRTPQAFLCQAWSERPQAFVHDPHHESVGLEIVPC